MTTSSSLEDKERPLHRQQSAAELGVRVAAAGPIINLIPWAVCSPALFTYQNFGNTTEKGLELGIEGSLNRNVNVFVNYSFQAEPTVDFDLSEANLPARNRFNAGFNFTKDKTGFSAT